MASKSSEKSCEARVESPIIPPNTLRLKIQPKTISVETTLKPTFSKALDPSIHFHLVVAHKGVQKNPPFCLIIECL